MSKQEKRGKIVQAALALIAEHGFHGAPVATIAARARVGAGTIYRHFENKDELIAALYRELEGQIHAAILKGYAPEEPVRGRFLHLGSALLRYFIENPLDFRYLEQFHNSPYGVVFRRNKFLGENHGNDIFRELFQEGVSRKVLKDLPLVILFALAFGPLLAAARDNILGLVCLDDKLITRTIAACWDAIRI